MGTSESTRNPPKRLGVLGTLVRDTILLPGVRRPAKAWGGIAYALAAFDHVLPPGWVVVPVIKVGNDTADRALPFLRSFATVGDLACVLVVPEPNNRVELTYTTQIDRVEVLAGGVPGWSAREIAVVLPGLDALYVNFISGVELDLAGALTVGDKLHGPSYADLHSLFLDIGSDGRRSPRYLPSSGRWAGCFDTVQMNENEFELFVRGAPDPWRVAEKAMAGRLGRIVVTRGADGAEIMTIGQDGAPPARESVPAAAGPAAGDPTGCGDVWGATFFASVLGHAAPGSAAHRANRLACDKVAYTGSEAFRDAALRDAASGGATPGSE